MIGIDADEAEYLAEFLDRDECAQRGQAQQVPFQQVPHQSGPLQQVTPVEPAPEGKGEYTSSALHGAPVPLGRGRQLPDQPRDIAAWTSGELPGQVPEQLASWPPGQVPEQLASWPPGLPSATDQPPASA